MDQQDKKRRVLIYLIGHLDSPAKSPQGGPVVDFAKHLRPHEIILLYSDSPKEYRKVFKKAAEFSQTEIIETCPGTLVENICIHLGEGDTSEMAWKMGGKIELDRIIRGRDKDYEQWFGIYYGPTQLTGFVFDYLEDSRDDLNLIRYERQSLIKGDIYYVKEVRIKSDTDQRPELIEKEKQEALIYQMMTHEEFHAKVDSFIGASTKMRKVIGEIIKDVFPDYNVMIIGERGVGKEVVAKAIHKAIHKVYHDEKEFHAYNCSMIPSRLIESQLFGYAKGAFTGAEKDTKGLFESWNGHVVFLDEIADMGKTSALAQLNRLLQDGSFYRVGETKERSFDGIIMAATNKDVYDPEVFPPDLLDRFDWIIEVPPLRERKEDIPLLVEHFRKKYKLKKPPSISIALMNRLESYRWPGNVRELEKWVKHIMRVFDNHSSPLSKKKVKSRLPKARVTTGKKIVIPEFTSSYHLKDCLEDVRNFAVKRALDQTGGNQAKAAEIIGMSPSFVKSRNPKR